MMATPILLLWDAALERARDQVEAVDSDMIFAIEPGEIFLPYIKLALIDDLPERISAKPRFQHPVEMTFEIMSNPFDENSATMRTIIQDLVDAFDATDIDDPSGFTVSQQYVTSVSFDGTIAGTQQETLHQARVVVLFDLDTA